MARIVMELTNRCNLRCRHCFDQRHAGSGDLPLGLIEKVLRDARACGVDHVSFSGGEPTLHRHFAEILERIREARCTFGLVSNGSTFRQIYPLLLAYRESFAGVTFSLDGARRETHDRLRGAGSFRQVMRAASICHVKALPFTFNMVLTHENHHEIDDLVELASRLGSDGVRFGHLMAGPGVETGELDLSPNERRAIEARIWRLQKNAPIPVGMAPGYYSESPFFPCGPLVMEEFNIDYKGNLTLCCHLSGHSAATPSPDHIANLEDVSLAEACARFGRRVATYLEDKRVRVARGDFGDLDHFPCRYCAQYLDAASGPIRPIPMQWLQNH
ncbi:MAG TPA: radical SAM protein [Vicinamibacterales bacterium]|nr:radical SAM protein [Vicinamibacterales bacterium]